MVHNFTKIKKKQTSGNGKKISEQIISENIKLAF